MSEYCIVKTIVANLYKEPSFKSELVTQALLKEKLYILDKKHNWYNVKQWDGYESWVHKFYIDIGVISYIDNPSCNYGVGIRKCYPDTINKFRLI